MRKIQVIKIEFEALGSERTCYTHRTHYDLEYIVAQLKTIHETAHLSAVSTDLVTIKELATNRFETIVSAHRRYIRDYKTRQ